MRHVCPERERMQEMQTPRGFAAYAFYSDWMKFKHRKAPPSEKFVNSRYYKNFIKFVDWVDKLAVPNAQQFIKVMVDADVDPALWCRDNTYAMYLQWYDNAYPPTEQFLETFDKLRSLAEEAGVPLNSVYQAVGPSELVKLVRRRKISPWLLVLSPNFLSWIQSIPEADRDALGAAINFGAYAAKLNSNPDLTRELRKVCESENV